MALPERFQRSAQLADRGVGVARALALTPELGLELGRPLLSRHSRAALALEGGPETIEFAAELRQRLGGLPGQVLACSQPRLGLDQPGPQARLGAGAQRELAAQSGDERARARPRRQSACRPRVATDARAPRWARWEDESKPLNGSRSARARTGAASRSAGDGRPGGSHPNLAGLELRSVAVGCRHDGSLLGLVGAPPRLAELVLEPAHAIFGGGELPEGLLRAVGLLGPGRELASQVEPERALGVLALLGGSARGLLGGQGRRELLGPRSCLSELALQVLDQLGQLRQRRLGLLGPAPDAFALELRALPGMFSGRPSAGDEITCRGRAGRVFALDLASRSVASSPSLTSGPGNSTADGNGTATEPN